MWFENKFSEIFCAYARVCIGNYSSLFLRVGPDAYQRDRFAFLGPLALSQ